MGGHRFSPRFRPDRSVARCVLSLRRAEGAGLKSSEEVMEILEAFDLAGSLRGAAELAGCDHKTVAHWVRRARGPAAGCRWRSGRGRGSMRSRRRSRSGSSARAGRSAPTGASAAGGDGLSGLGAHDAAGGRRAKRRWRPEHGRKTRPWVVEPGLWMQWDYGDGPVVAGRTTVLFCAWLAWSRFRVVLALWDRTMPSVVMALDRALRASAARRPTR